MPRVDLSDPAVFHDNYRTNVSRLKGALDRTPNDEPRLILNYHRWPEMVKKRLVASGLCQGTLGLSSGMKIIILGGGFGWLQEAIEELITADIVTTDTSPWVQAVKDQDESADVTAALDAAGVTDSTKRGQLMARYNTGPRARRPIFNEDLNTGGSRGRIKQALGLQGNAKADYVITEQVLPWLEDNECTVVSDVAHSIANNVVHILTPFAPSNKLEPGPLWNWKHIDSPGEPTRPDLALQPWYTTTNWKSLLPNDLFISINRVTTRLDYEVV